MGIHKLIPGALNEHKEKVQKPHFLFSAENPRHPHKNEMNLTHEQALNHLKSRGFDAHEVNGHYGAPEKSIIVYGVGPKHSEQLHHFASKLGQDSSIYSNGQNHEMRFHHGADQGKRVRGKGTVWHSEKPGDFFTTLPGGTHHFTHNFDFDNPEMGKSEKIGDLREYRKNAKEGCDVLFRVKIRGKHKLEEGIPLHMSIKIFKSVEEADLEKLKKQVKELNLTERPEPGKLEFKPSIFTGRDGNKYYMLMINCLDPKFEKFYDMNKDRGTVYDNGFMPHITINQSLYEEIKEKGLDPRDVEFEPLIMEAGAGNTHHEFDESLEKAAFKNTLAALSTVGAMIGSPVKSNVAMPKQTAPQAQAQKPASNPYSSKRMLATIADVESKGGKYTHHKPVEGKMHQGESAIGKYALMPEVVRETVHMNPDLKNKYKKLMALKGDDMRRYIEDNPGLEDTIAQRHLQRLEHHFGKDPSTLGYAWLEGVSGTYKAKKENKNIADHWHVKKINDAYTRTK